MSLINKKDKIYVAGSEGMVGSAIVRYLKNNGYKNIVVNNRSKLNLLNYSAVESWFKKEKPDIVIIAAAKVGGIYANNNYPAEFLLENIKIQTNLIELSQKNDVKRLLFLGSSCIYPKFANQPISEEELMNAALEKTNESYAIAKITGIKLVDAFRKQYGFDGISLMPTNLYGYGDNYNLMNSHVVPAMIRRFIEAKNTLAESVVCWGTGSPLRELLNVDDLAIACIFALENWDPSNKGAPRINQNEELTYLNVGSEDEISIRDLASLISDLVGYKGSIIWDENQPDGTPRKKLNYEKFKSMGWNTSIELSLGLKQTIQDFKIKLNKGLLRI
ncbi:GDP-fucose synthetase [Prochlorococcus marinus str. MU1404]|uniref:GDP-L-fucose synthase family protein n=1 Tax=Prochlorococcus marinus TaxID=1219 RepID=UPI001ADD2E41|nr:GDP-L-fucose synthase [Prochlorococcus marinus]MBO8230533.1 GDP-L-fucose synthase [Prochlorococcus marinus XMU1404]MBW3073579.1 GDP-fucose synthetase [Prochlorococcus marinus str. MU1404]MCR8545134.1 GDP-L-fucose synthase [Prochlorococcus marinus CUG1432]